MHVQRETTLLTSMDRNTASWQRHHDQDSEPMQALQQLQASINAGQHDHTIKDLQQMHAQHQAQMREREGRFAELQEELSVVAAASESPLQALDLVLQAPAQHWQRLCSIFAGCLL